MLTSTRAVYYILVLWVFFYENCVVVFNWIVCPYQLGL